MSVAVATPLVKTPRRVSERLCKYSMPMSSHDLRFNYTPTHRRLGRNSFCFSVWGILLGT
jgi:hypothetical protein